MGCVATASYTIKEKRYTKLNRDELFSENNI